MGSNVSDFGASWAELSDSHEPGDTVAVGDQVTVELLGDFFVLDVHWVPPGSDGTVGVLASFDGTEE